MVKKHFGEVRKGRFIPFDKMAFIRAFAKNEGKVVAVMVEPRKQTRSNNQNAYYFGVVLEMISEETGHTAEELHDYFKVQFNSKETEIGKMPQTTTGMTPAEFEKYLENIKRFAAEKLGIYIPDPNQIMI